MRNWASTVLRSSNWCHFSTTSAPTSLVAPQRDLAHHGNFRNLNWRYLPHRKDLWPMQGLCKRISPENIASYGTVPPFYHFSTDMLHGLQDIQGSTCWAGWEADPRAPWLRASYSCWSQAWWKWPCPAIVAAGDGQGLLRWSMMILRLTDSYCTCALFIFVHMCLYPWCSCTLSGRRHCFSDPFI